MAKRRFRRARAAFARVGRRFRRSSSRGTVSSNIPIIVGGAAYGAGRAWIADKVSPYTSKLPLGNIADEVGMGVLLIVAKKLNKGRMPWLNHIANGGLAVESARIGEAIASGSVGMGSSSSGNLVNQGFLYG